MFSWETQGQSNEIPMKDAGKTEKKKKEKRPQESKNPKKMGLSVKLVLWTRYLIIWKTYSTRNNNPSQIITWELHSVQLNANLTKEHYNLQDFPNLNLLRQSKRDNKRF